MFDKQVVERALDEACAQALNTGDAGRVDLLHSGQRVLGVPCAEVVMLICRNRAGAERAPELTRQLLLGVAGLDELGQPDEDIFFAYAYDGQCVNAYQAYRHCFRECEQKLLMHARFIALMQNTSAKTRGLSNAKKIMLPALVQDREQFVRRRLT